MTKLQQLQQSFQDLWRGLGRVFGPVKNVYPASGMSPLPDDTNRESRRHRRRWSI